MKITASNMTALWAGVVLGPMVAGTSLAIDRGVPVPVAISAASILVAPLILVFVSGQGLPRLIEPSHEIISRQGQLGLLRRVASWMLGFVVSIVPLAVYFRAAG